MADTTVKPIDQLLGNSGQLAPPTTPQGVTALGGNPDQAKMVNQIKAVPTPEAPKPPVNVPTAPANPQTLSQFEQQSREKAATAATNGQVVASADKMKQFGTIQTMLDASIQQAAAGAKPTTDTAAALASTTGGGQDLTLGQLPTGSLPADLNVESILGPNWHSMTMADLSTKLQELQARSAVTPGLAGNLGQAQQQIAGQEAVRTSAQGRVAAAGDIAQTAEQTAGLGEGQREHLLTAIAGKDTQLLADMKALPPTDAATLVGQGATAIKEAHAIAATMLPNTAKVLGLDPTSKFITDPAQQAAIKQAQPNIQAFSDALSKSGGKSLDYYLSANPTIAGKMRDMLKDPSLKASDIPRIVDNMDADIAAYNFADTAVKTSRDVLAKVKSGAKLDDASFEHLIDVAFGSGADADTLNKSYQEAQQATEFGHPTAESTQTLTLMKQLDSNHDGKITPDDAKTMANWLFQRAGGETPNFNKILVGDQVVQSTAPTVATTLAEPVGVAAAHEVRGYKGSDVGALFNHLMASAAGDPIDAMVRAKKLYAGTTAEKQRQINPQGWNALKEKLDLAAQAKSAADAKALDDSAAASQAAGAAMGPQPATPLPVPVDMWGNIRNIGETTSQQEQAIQKGLYNPNPEYSGEGYLAGKEGSV